MLITQLGKNKEGTGLSNIVSYLYANRKNNEKINITFDTDEWIKEITLFRQDHWDKKGYTFIIPKTISKNKTEETFFSTKQDTFIPKITYALFQLWFKDKWNEIKDKNIEKKTEDLFDDTLTNDIIEDFDQFSFDDKDNNETNKLWSLEVLNIIFKENQKVVWPKELDYEKIGVTKVKEYSDTIKKIHYYKTLVGPTMIDQPLQYLSKFAISSTSFNTWATWSIPLVIEWKDWTLQESVKFNVKTLVSNWRVRVPFLYATLTNENFNLLSEKGNITEEEYKQWKFYKVPLGECKTWSFDIWEKLIDSTLVNKNILDIPQDEIVETINNLEILKIKQTVYNRKIKELNWVISSKIETRYEDKKESYWINKDWILEWKLTGEEKLEWKTEIIKSIDIWIIGLKKSSLSKEETKILDEYIGSLEDKTLKELKDILEDITEKRNNIKNKIEETRYKQSLIANAMFLNGFSDNLNYVKNEEGMNETIDNSKAKGVVDWQKKTRIIETKDWKIKAKISLYELEKHI